MLVNTTYAIQEQPEIKPVISGRNGSSTPGAAGRPKLKSPRKERRKTKRDRRKCVREGVFVSLSTNHDRRKVRDRRRFSISV